ncbi:MAG: hypothetical protein Q9207_002602 [Kuettlingeria erythrocarpa]
MNVLAEQQDKEMGKGMGASSTVALPARLAVSSPVVPASAANVEGATGEVPLLSSPSTATLSNPWWVEQMAKQAKWQKHADELGVLSDPEPLEDCITATRDTIPGLGESVQQTGSKESSSSPATATINAAFGKDVLENHPGSDLDLPEEQWERMRAAEGKDNSHTGPPVEQSDGRFTAESFTATDQEQDAS